MGSYEGYIGRRIGHLGGIAPTSCPRLGTGSARPSEPEGHQCEANVKATWLMRRPCRISSAPQWRSISKAKASQSPVEPPASGQLASSQVPHFGVR